MYDYLFLLVPEKHLLFEAVKITFGAEKFAFPIAFMRSRITYGIEGFSR